MARFYGQAQLKVIIPILGLVGLVQGFRNIGLVLLRREISFARIFWYELAHSLGKELRHATSRTTSLRLVIQRRG